MEVNMGDFFSVGNKFHIFDLCNWENFIYIHTCIDKEEELELLVLCCVMFFLYKKFEIKREESKSKAKKSTPYLEHNQCL